MKKLVFGLIAMMLFSTISFGQNKPASATGGQNEVKSLSRIHISFGRKSRDCSGFGICAFTVDITVSDVLNIISAVSKDGKIKTTFTSDFYEANKGKFVNGYLVIEEDFTIDKATTTALGLADGYKIKTGRYLVVIDKSTGTCNCTF